MRSRSPLLLTGVAIAAVVLSITASGSAQSDGARTVTVFQDGLHARLKFIDVVPKSPAAKLTSKRFRLSPGDTLIASSPLLVSDGGDRIGTAYLRGTVVVGGRLSGAVVLGETVLKFHDGQIVLAGASGLTVDSTPAPVVGGSGAYEGARGSAAPALTEHGSETTIRLLP